MGWRATKMGNLYGVTASAATLNDTLTATAAGTTYLPLAVSEVGCAGAVAPAAGDSGKTYYNTAATDITLPAISNGLRYKFVVKHASYLKVIASGGATIRYQATATAANGYFRSQTVGNVATVEGVNGDWIVTDLEGTFTYDA